MNKVAMFLTLTLPTYAMLGTLVLLTADIF
jgi:hypothetical protein